MIGVERTATQPDGWRFLVRVSGADGATEHEVTLAKGDCERLAGAALSPEALVEKTFEFLLARESNRAIFRQFDLAIVSRYFPEFEAEIKGRT